MQKTEMDDVLKDISLRFYKRLRVTKFICEHPLLFAKRRIEDDNDDRAIMVTFFGKFVLKYGKNNNDKINNKKNYEKVIAARRNQKLNLNVNENDIL